MDNCADTTFSIIFDYDNLGKDLGWRFMATVAGHRFVGATMEELFGKLLNAKVFTKESCEKSGFLGVENADDYPCSISDMLHYLKNLREDGYYDR